jgi:hypothetical protein
VVATRTRTRSESAAAPSPAARRAAGREAAIQTGGSPWLQLAALVATAGCVAAGVSGIAGHSEWQVPALGVGAGFAMIALGAAIRAEVEAGSGVWIVVDHVAADPDEADLLYLDGRVVDSGQPKTVVADEDAFLPRRRQT